MFSDQSIQSPCNNDCLIEPKTNLCKGCFRTIDEIIHWINYSDEKKIQIMEFIKSRRESFSDKHNAQT